MALNDVFSYYSGIERDGATAWRLGPWVWASQGHMLVAVRDDGREADVTPERFRKAQRYLDDVPAMLDTVSLSALRTFAGAILPAHVDCQLCDGTGRDGQYGQSIECEHCGELTRPECSHCGGSGDEGIEIRYGRVAGVPVNLVLLAFGLAQVPNDETVAIGTIPSLGLKPSFALAVIGNGWRVVLMSCRDVAADVPSFDRSEESAAVGAVDPVDGIATK